MREIHSVRFPSDSTSATGRRVLSDALTKADPVGARAVTHETNWRRQYLAHFRRAVEAGLGDPAAAWSIAHDGLESLRAELLYGDVPLSDAATLDTPTRFRSVEFAGAVDAETELSLPYRGERLRGRDLLDHLDDWVARGIVTRSCADAVAEVMDHPQWLRLDDRTVVVLGAGAEMGPYRALQRWGATVAAVDLPTSAVAERIASVATHGAGRTSAPALADRPVGADLVTELPALARWIETLPGQLVLGSYCYADGSAHVTVNAAADALGTHLLDVRPGTALAFLATPTDVFAVPHDEVTRAEEAYRAGRTLLRVPARVLSGGRLLQRNYPPGADVGICDALVPQQGPNYALAKRIQRWRATDALHQGATVSLNVAPATRTRSVVKNKALAAAYAGAHRFGVEVFEPATSNTLMAALLVHDLHTSRPPADEPWQDEADQAAHGGLWTAAYHPRSALGLAAVFGMGTLTH